MFKKSLLLMLLMALLAPWAANAQETVTIGEGTATCNTNPIGTYYNYSIAEQLYTADEIGMAGTISSVSFYYRGIAAKDLPITMYMKHVEDADLATAGISLADAEEVFSGTLSVTTTAGWVTITLDTPFDYDGTSNLLIGFIKDYLYYFSGQSWQGTATTSTMARYTQNDDNAYTTSTVPGNAQANRPNLQMVITPSSGPTCEKPATFEVSNITGYTADFEWERTDAGNYTFEYKKGSDSEWTVVAGLSEETYQLANLEPFTTYNARVKAVCGTDLESGYRATNFTTLEVCPDGFVCIGSGTQTSSMLPTYTYYNYSLSQQIYTAAEIGGAGAIMSISFFSTASQRTRSLDIYMVNTEKTSFASTSDWITASAADLVYSGSVTFVQNDWTTITLDSPFQYADDTKNVALIVNDKTGGYVSSPSFLVFDSTEGCAIYSYNDNNGYDPFAPTVISNSGSVAKKNKIRLVMGELSDCDMPTDLAVSNITMQTADLTWTAGGSETAWQVCINGDETNAVDVTSPSYQLTGLTGATSYTVKVRANCGGSYSYWTPEVSFNTAICDETDQCQISYVLSLTSTSYTTWHSATIDVVDVETNIVLATVSYDIAPTGTVAVCNGHDVKFVYNPATPAYYNSYNSFAFNDVNGEEIFSGTGTGSMSSATELYTYTVDCAVTSCRKPTDLAASEIGPHSAQLSWTENGEATAWVVAYSKDGENFDEVNADANPFTLTGLEAETEYIVKVRPECGEVLKWSETFTFPTDVACPAPTAFALDTVTNNSATFSWQPTTGDFELRYIVDNNPVYDFDDSDMQGWTNIDADGDGYEWVLGSAAGGIYLAEGGSLAGTGHEESADFVTSGSYSNYTGAALTPDNYLVSPQITLGGSISFWACGQDASYAAEHFGVAVSTTGNTDDADFTTIQEWTMTAKGIGAKANPGTTRSGNRDQGAWYVYTVDLSEYTGQGYVAIRHFDCTDMFLLNVDDITISQPGDAEWVTVNATENPFTITDLDPETKYIAQLRSNCGEDGYSAWTTAIAFTTNPNCMVPTNLVISEIEKRSAKLAWTANGEEDTWQICLNDDETNLIETTENPYVLTGLTPATDYTVKVRAYCSDELQSAWSRPLEFTTTIACPAPAALSAEPTPDGAVVTWTGDDEADYEIGWASTASDAVLLQYDDNTFATAIGSASAGNWTWAVMYPSSMLNGNRTLSVVQVFEMAGYYQNDYTVSFYNGDDSAPTTELGEISVTPSGVDGFHTIMIPESIDIDPDQNLWIVLNMTGTYVMSSCETTEPNNQWVYSDGSWANIGTLAPSLAGYGWMVRGLVGSMDPFTSVTGVTSPYTIEGLDSETTYFARVKSLCGDEDGESDWVYFSFTTLENCPMPSDFILEELTYSHATISWTGFNDSYNVQMGQVGTPAEVFSADFADGTIPSDFVNDETYPWTVEEGNEGKCIKSGNAGVSSSTSAITITKTVTGTIGTIEFDAECKGEGTSTFWDHCDFYIDDELMFKAGANISGWNHYSYDFNGGTHTFKWSYTKDSSVNPTGDYFSVTNIVIKSAEMVWEDIVSVEETEYTFENLEPETTYYFKVQGVCGGSTTEWTPVYNFTTPIISQTLELTEGWNWVSLYVEGEDAIATLLMLETALGDNAYQISSADFMTEYDEEWFGDLDEIGITNDQTYMILAAQDCTVVLEGDLSDPASIEITINPDWNWIGFPIDHEMDIEEALANLDAEEGDMFANADEFTEFDGEEWYGDIETLLPGQGFMYFNSTDEVKTFSYPSAKKRGNNQPILKKVGAKVIANKTTEFPTKK